MTKKPPKIRDLTPEEEAEVKAQIAADPDTWEAPPGAKVLRRGRPRGQTKEQVTIRLDKDLLARLRQNGKGWQTRINKLLRQALDM